MFSPRRRRSTRCHINRLQRYFFALQVRHLTTPQGPLKLWVKHNGSQSTQVPIEGCTNIDDFAEKVKQKLNTNCQVSVFTSLEKEALRPGLTINELLKTNEFKNNTDESPLFVKLILAAQDSITSKTIYVQDIDEECQPVDRFTEVIVENDADVRQILGRNGEALYHLSNPKQRVTKSKQLIDGEKYNVYSRYWQSFTDEVRWQQKENAAMEEEVALAMKKYLNVHLGSAVIDMPTDVLGSKGNMLQEWDAAFKVDDILYLCEAKHVMSTDKLPKISQRIQIFKEKFLPQAQEQFSMGINKIIGVACATYFPPLVRQEAHDLGFICVYPSGLRYRVDKWLPIEFKIER